MSYREESRQVFTHKRVELYDVTCARCGNVPGKKHQCTTCLYWYCTFCIDWELSEAIYGKEITDHKGKKVYDFWGNPMCICESQMCFTCTDQRRKTKAQCDEIHLNNNKTRK